MVIVLLMLLAFAGWGLPHLRPANRVMCTVAMAMVWGFLLWADRGNGAAAQFGSGYLLEWALSLDNLLAFWVVFKYFKLDERSEARVLSIGLITAVVGRFLAAWVGSLAIHAFFPIMQGIFAIAIAYTGYKVLLDIGGKNASGPDVPYAITKITDRLAQVGFRYTPTVKEGKMIIKDSRGRWCATPMFVAMIIIEATDMMFSVDSIPTVVAVSREPLIIFSASMFAVVGLRAAYTLVSQGLLKYDLAIPIVLVLFFVAAKLMAEALFGWVVGPVVTVAIISGLLAAWISGVVYEKKVEKD